MYLKSKAVVVLVSFCFLSTQVLAGKLESFENSVEKPVSSYEELEKSDSLDDDDRFCEKDVNGECVDNDSLIAIPFYIMLYGGLYSFVRVFPDAGSEPSGYNADVNSQFTPRKAGEKLIPFLRIGTMYQTIDPGVELYDIKLEAGVGPLSLNYNKSLYEEQQPLDGLDLTRIYGSYRMSFGDHVQIDFGLGALTLEGNERKSYFYSTVPILIHPTEHLGFEYKFGLAANIVEHDISVLGKFRFTSLALGYKWLTANNESLSGPYAEWSVYY